MSQSIIYAFDFDGVICDSALETAITGWKAAGKIWTDMPDDTPQVLIAQFRLIRPMIETGYEAILAMRLLFLGDSCEAIFSDYQTKIQQLMQEANVTADDLKILFGATRDIWIANDRAGWIAMNPLFPGVKEKLERLSQTQTWHIITTKHERFVKKILNAHAIELAGERIYGLDRNMSKPDVLKQLLKAYPQQTIEFVEDRLPTLLNVQKEPELASVKLLFATWGYNTEEDKGLAALKGFKVLSLQDFV
jgi:phosphoglycolate phosphatase-like HAD superfamily hydrolase